MNIYNIAIAIGALVIGAGAGAGWNYSQTAPQVALVCPVAETATPAMQHFSVSTPIPTTGSKGF